ncbi:OTU domain-containing protein [Pseudomonas citri]|uniref:OTU domain-containing protein n=1 Tax=Pseudomonas citri TaxID=2978349 RepID=UPI0021B6AE7B|nr:OTU domain-containing protein [Pseudomonas citri]
MKPISLLPNGIRFQPHEFADQWLGQWGLTGDAQVQATYQEVVTVDSAAERKTASVPLRAAVTQGFLAAHQSRASSSALSPREGWVYPHRSHLSLDFSSLRAHGKALSPDVLRQLQAGIAPGYQGVGQPVITEVDAQGNLLGAREKEQLKQLDLLDANQVKLARLFAALPTFDTVLKSLLVSRLKARISAGKFRALVPEHMDPDHCYVNHFTVDALGKRSLTSSQRFTDVMSSSLATDTPPTYTTDGVGFFTRPDTVQEADSLFASPLDRKTVATLESVFYIAQPVTNESLKGQFLEDLVTFRQSKSVGAALDAPNPGTAEAALAHLLARRFMSLLDLYKVDRDPASQLTPSERAQQHDEDRLLDLITSHPRLADRNRLLRAPIPHVYAVMLDMGSAAPRKWPAAMVIKRADQPALFLYSLEGGIQKFRSFQDLVNTASPVYAGQKRTIRDISTELTGHVFETAADDLLQFQSAALQAFLDAPANETLALPAFALGVDDALDLPMLSLAGPLAVRQHALVEDNRPDFFKTATSAQKSHYCNLELSVLDAAYALAGSDIKTLLQFTRQKIKQYLQETVHPDIDPDPDQTQVTFFYGEKANPRQSRVTSLTQLLLDNLRPSQHPNAMREVLSAYLVDPDGERVRNPANGYFVTLTGRELARMVTSIDAGGSYEAMLREQMNKPAYKQAWQTAYRANLKFKGYEASLKGDAAFKATLVDKAFNPPKPTKKLTLWLDAVLRSSSAEQRTPVMGRRVHVYALVLGGSMAATDPHGHMGNAISINGALVFSDQEGPQIKGTVGVYFPDSPQGEDFHEFADLSDGVAELLPREDWQEYFRSRISTNDPSQIKRTLGQQGGRPLIRGALITGDLLEALHRAHVNFHSAHADHRSNSNRNVRHQTYGRLGQMMIEIVMELAGLFLAPGFQMLKSAIKTGLLVYRTGAIPLNLKTLAFVHAVANHGGWRLTRSAAVSTRGQSFFRAVTARQGRDEAMTGLPLDMAIYGPYAVTDASVIRGLSADTRGFYRATISHAATGRVMDRPVYVRQPDGTVFRVHDHTKLDATEATLVNPMTGLGIRASGVMRSTVARMPDGEWRAVGFGRGGGKRPGNPDPQPGPSKPKTVATAASALSVRMDLVPSIMTRLANWPQNRSLLIIDRQAPEHVWSVRFTPGQEQTIYPMEIHPGRADTDVVLIRLAQDHYSVELGGEVVEIPGGGDCFFEAVNRGLNEGQAEQALSMQGWRNEVANYIDQHPQLGQYVAPLPTRTQQALFENASSLHNLLGQAAVLDLTRIVYGAPNPNRLFQPTLRYLDLHANSTVRMAITAGPSSRLPPEILQHVGRLLSPRPPARLTPSVNAPFSGEQRQSMKQMFEDLLVGPVENELVEDLLDNQFLLVSNDVVHILLEYGVTARQLLDHHPHNSSAYVLYDEALHGHLDEDQMEALLDGAYLVNSDDLDDAKDLLVSDAGRYVDDTSELFDHFIYTDTAERTVDLFRTALRRFPDLLRRANLLLRSPIIAHNLGGLLRVSEVARWIRNPALSDVRFQIVAEYASTRHSELQRTRNIDIDWMQVFDDRNLRNIVLHQEALGDFLEFLGGAWGNIMDNDIPAVAKLFSAPGQLPSNSRVAVLFNTPNLWTALRKLRKEYADQVWADLIGPYFSDATIRQALAWPGALSSEMHLALALRNSLAPEELRANLTIQRLLSIGQRRAQQYLYNFDFPTDRLGHRRLDFALYVESHLSIPDWAWQYARRGVTPQSLKKIGEVKPRPE